MARTVPVPRLIRELAPRYGIDAAAAIAVARGEGGLVNRAGDVGDLAGGGSFGPFQLYTKGALPAQFRGKPAAADSWAWSPDGIGYALRKMKEAGAGGLQGRAAVEAIVRRFERPADPDTSVRNAIGRLGSEIAAVPAATAPAPARITNELRAAPVDTGPDRRRQFATELLGARAGGGKLDTRALLSAVLARRAPDPAQLAAPAAAPGPAAPTLPGQPSATGPTGPKRAQAGGGNRLNREFGIDDAFHTPLGYSIDEGKRWDRTIANHDKHGHVSATDPGTMLRLIKEGQRRGLSVRENPYVDKVDPVHTKGSDHYSNFADDPATPFDEGKLGRAGDFSGDPKKLAAFMRWVYAKAGA